MTLASFLYSLFNVTERRCVQIPTNSSHCDVGLCRKEGRHLLYEEVYGSRIFYCPPLLVETMFYLFLNFDSCRQSFVFCFVKDCRVPVSLDPGHQ